MPHKILKLTKEDIRHLNEVADLFAGGHSLRGWRRFKSTYREMDAYYNTRKGLVLKKPKFILDDRTPKCLRVPTIKLKNGWSVQPLVKKINLKKALVILNDRVKKYPNIWPDLHTENIGWYNGKPLMFDW